MQTVSVNARRVEPYLDLETDLQRARVLAHLLDAEFEVGGIRFGLDAIAGLVPVLGDTVSAIAGIYPIHIARKHNLGKRVQWQMWMNLGIDYLGGIVPVIGDIFDVAFKANLKNLALLEQAARNAEHR